MYKASLRSHMLLLHTMTCNCIWNSYLSTVDIVGFIWFWFFFFLLFFVDTRAYLGRQIKSCINSKKLIILSIWCVKKKKSSMRLVCSSDCCQESLTFLRPVIAATPFSLVQLQVIMIGNDLGFSLSLCSLERSVIIWSQILVFPMPV